MNFLSHFYFDRDNANGYMVLGTIMPDLIKNADKDIMLHPEKLQHRDDQVNLVIAGWKTHLEVDRYFHSSDFFLHYAHQLKKKLLPALDGSPVKPFFLGHVGLELILDNLLLINNLVSTDSFYRQLESCGQPVINEFLKFAGFVDTIRFFKFYDDFKKSRYLDSYCKIDAITYALKRICMRIWENPFTPAQEHAMNQVLTEYRNNLEGDFTGIYNEIKQKLVKATPGSKP